MDVLWNAGGSAFIQEALWISEQCYGICQLAGCFVSLCVVDIGIMGVVIDTLIGGRLTLFQRSSYILMSLNSKNSKFSSPMPSKNPALLKLLQGIASINLGYVIFYRIKLLTNQYSVYATRIFQHA